ncbi:MAG: hypothetical protein JWR38_1868 [Mucilaginibacter sp.]|nr:hypothetical protein [Mucilaginibacter sp.]
MLCITYKISLHPIPPLLIEMTILYRDLLFSTIQGTNTCRYDILLNKIL